MDFRILGPVEVHSGGEQLRLGGPRQRALLTYLLLHANEVVAGERLLDELWLEAPRGGLAALQTHVSRLRRILGDRIATSGSGYAIRVEPDELDLERFRSLLAQAGATADPRARSRLLRDAEALWHGEPLAGLDVPFAAGEAAALEELRLAALEDRIEADLDTGLDGELVSELSGLVRHHPLRERLRGELILALYRSGRQADALEAYRETRQMLDEELGLEPTPALRELERAILRHDPALNADSAAVVRAEAADRVEPSPPHRRRRILATVGGFVLLLAASAATAFTVVHFRSTAHTPEAAKAAVAVTPPTHTSPATRRRKAPSVHHVVHRKTVMHRRLAKPTTHTTPSLVAAVKPTATTPTSQTQSTTQPARVKKRAKAPPATTTQKPTPWTTLHDDFSESTPNWQVWSTDVEGAGATWTLGDGRLEMTLPAAGIPGGRYDQLLASFDSVCQFDGDFDARVDYQLLDWPVPTGARVQLSAWIFPDVNSDAARTSTQGGEGYDGNVGSSYRSVPTNDPQGTLRVTRTAGLIKTYYLAGGKWVELYSGEARGRVMLGLVLFATAGDWQQKETRAAFDNFSVSAPTRVCA
jgi:DNA-binding SARP family transcriptional activator